MTGGVWCAGQVLHCVRDGPVLWDAVALCLGRSSDERGCDKAINQLKYIPVLNLTPYYD